MIEVPALGLIAVACLVLGFAAFALARSVLESGVAALRLALWQLHDDLVDAITSGDLTNYEDAFALRRAVRVTIENSRDLTVLKVFGNYFLVRLTGGHKVLERVGRRRLSVLTADLSDPQLIQFREQLREITRTYVYRTTLFGRLGIVLVPVAFLLWSLVSGELRRTLNSPAVGTRNQPQGHGSAETLAGHLADRPIRVELIEDLVGRRNHNGRSLAASCC